MDSTELFVSSNDPIIGQNEAAKYDIKSSHQNNDHAEKLDILAI